MNSKALRYFIIGTFVTLYAIVSVISTIHVIDFFKLSNPDWLAISLAVAFEIGAAASLASLIALKKMNRGLVWGLFIVLTCMQMMGNTFYAFTHLHDYQGWIDLFGLTDEEPLYQKRVLSIISGAVLPLVALGFIKSLVDYIKPTEEEEKPAKKKTKSKETSDKVWKKVNELRAEGKLPTPTEEDLADEPTALAFTPYMTEEELSEWDATLNDGLEEIEEEMIATTADDKPSEETVVEETTAPELTKKDIETYQEKTRMVVDTPKKPGQNWTNPQIAPGLNT